MVYETGRVASKNVMCVRTPREKRQRRFSVRNLTCCWVPPLLFDRRLIYCGNSDAFVVVVVLGTSPRPF